jgi:type I restriction enzyme, S subunit
MKSQLIPLADLCEINLESITKEYPHEIIEYTDISSVSSGYLSETPKEMLLRDAPSRAKRIIKDGDTILAMVRPNLRSFLFVKNPKENSIVSTGFAILRSKSNVDPRFVYYAVTQQHFTDYLSNNAKGTSYPAVDVDTVLRGEIPRFEYTEQQTIASILSVYDDLIENNRRRIQLLEESARLLYKEWFVHLRFPGHEHVKIKDGVPEKWTKTTISDLCDSVNYGYTASATAEPVGPKFLRITDIVPDVINWSSVPFCSIPENKKEQFLLKEGDVVVARTGATTGYAKRIGKTRPETVFASYLVRLRLKAEIDDMLVGIFVESEDYKSYIKRQLGGAAQPNANAKIISSAKILMPPISIQRHFHEMVSPIFESKDNLQEQNEKLTQARDLLLPRLMNGEIAV